MLDPISLLSSDDEVHPDDDAAGPPGGVHGSKKRMRPVDRDHPIVTIGDRCIRALKRWKEQDNPEGMSCHVFSTQDEYTRKIDALNRRFAEEIQKREDELSRLRVQHSSDQNTSLKLISEASSEVSRLQEELATQKKDLETAMKGKDDAVLAAEKAAEVAEEKAASSAAATRVKAADVLNNLITDLMSYLTEKESRVTSSERAPTAPLKPLPPKAVQQSVLWIRQTNQNPAYSTVREIVYTRPTKGSSAGKWHFDSSDKKNDPNAKATWIEIVAPDVIAKLMTLGSMTKVRQYFNPCKGKKCSYTYSNHTYDVEVVYGVKPWVAAAAQAPAAAAAATTTPTATKPLGHSVLLDGPHFQPSSAQIQMYDSELDTDEDMHEVVGSKPLADLATRWSALSQGFKYDPTKTELWVKPRWLAMWLNVLQHRADYEIRIVGHGVRSNDFDALRMDPAGFNLAYSREGRAGFGCYVSVLDSIPADYTRHGALNSDGTYKNTDGTMVLGLLLVHKRSSGHISTNTSGNSFQDSNGAYEFYHLGSSRQNYIARNHNVNDAYNVRDPTLLLPLGKIVAM